MVPNELQQEILSFQKKTKDFESSLRGAFVNTHPTTNFLVIQRVNALEGEMRINIQKLLKIHTTNTMDALRVQSSIASAEVFLRKYKMVKDYSIPLVGDILALDVSLYLMKYRSQR